MDRYLLSSGKLTTDLVEYAIDYIKTYLIMRETDIPYSSFGNSMDLSVNIKSEVLYQVKLAANTVVAKLNSMYPKLNANITSSEFEDERISIRITMNNEDIKLVIN